jgi:hypothetical protein
MAAPVSESSAPAGVQDLWRELRELRETVVALRREMAPRHRVTLRVLQEGPFLGQPIDVVATVTGSGGKPEVDVPVTLTATWGRLRAVEDLRLRQGSGVTVRTDREGQARALLLPPASGDVSPLQQDALEVALQRLDRRALTPAQAAGGLRQMAREYRLDGNAELRRAIDLYFQEFGQRYRDSIESRSHAVWSTFDTTVFAFARDADSQDEDVLDTAVLATAVFSLGFKDWLGPWLQAMVQVMREESGLEGELLSSRRRFRQSDAFLSHVYGTVQLFLDNQKGIVGELAGRRAAETSLRNLLDDGLPDLPKDVRTGVLQGVETASGTLKSGGVGVLAAVGQTRKDLTRSIDVKIANVPKVDLTGVTGRIDQLTAQVSVKADATVIDGLRTEVRNSLASKVDQKALDTLNTGFNQQISTLNTNLSTTIAAKADATVIQGLRNEIQTSLATKADRTALETLSTNVTGVTRDLGTLRETTLQINDRVSRIDVSVGRFPADLATLNTDLNTRLLAKADATAIEGLRTEVKTSLASKADRTALDALNINVTRDISVLRERSTQVDQRITVLDTSVNRIDTTIKDPRIFRLPNG